jgi:Domain of unknown function (DUF4139)/N-terminal domain of unknown function (DUF4140)
MKELRMLSRFAVLALLATSAGAVVGLGAAEAGGAPMPNSRIAGVTVYQSSALVGREVSVPQGSGNLELVIPALPASTVQSSLYAEGNAEVRVLTTRYRSRPLAQTAQEDLRKLEAQLKDLQKSSELLQKQIETGTANLALLNKLEGFTQVTMKEMTDKGMLNAETVTKLSTYIMDTRGTKATEVVTLQQQVQAGSEQQQYVQREMARLAGSSDKTSREAVIVVDRNNAAPGKVMLYYLVSAASWKPQYKVRAAAGKPQVDVEYLAAISQQTGEDWNGVEVTLSTAMPMFSAAPPELAVLEVQPVSGAFPANMPGMPPGMGPQGQPASLNLNIDGKIALKRSGSNRMQQQELQSSAEALVVKGMKFEADREYNAAAAVAQADELMRDREELKQERGVAGMSREGQSVTFHLDRKLSIPWRDDEQLIEITRLSLPADNLYKAVPVLTSHVYRLANLTNSSSQVILPGEATMYFGSDFVGRASLPLVAVGQSFMAGFGVDPQIQVQRQLVDKTRNIQGGNQIQKFDYRITVNNYKSEEVKLQLWDRIPHAEGEAITVTLATSAPAISKEEAFVRDQQSKGLLRWDLTLAPNSSDAKASNVTYEYKLEYAKDASIGNIFNR